MKLQERHAMAVLPPPPLQGKDDWEGRNESLEPWTANEEEFRA